MLKNDQGDIGFAFDTTKTAEFNFTLPKGIKNFLIIFTAPIIKELPSTQYGA